MNDAPFFIVGFQRSGTTLLRLMLDAHTEVAIPLDTVGLWARYEQRLSEYGDISTEPGRSGLVGDLLAEERIRLWEVPLSRELILSRWTEPGFPGVIRAFNEAYASLKGKHRWGDKDPGNMQRIDQLNRWFPTAKFIHIIRDGRDACLSQLEQDFGFDNLFQCACAWREEVQWVRRLGAILGHRYFELHYEDLVAEPEKILAAVTCFLSIEFQPAMLRYHENVSKSVPEEKRHIWPLLDKPPQKSNIARWKKGLSSGAQICFEKRAGPLLTELGYETNGRASGAYLEEVKNLVGSAWKAVKRRMSKRP